MDRAEISRRALERLPVLVFACDNPQTWADYLRKLRSDLTWSQNDMAIRLGVSPSAIAHWEGGRRIPGRDICRRLGETLAREANLRPDEDPFLLQEDV